MNQQNTADFSQGSVGSRIMAQAIPLALAEIVQLLYNIVDRVFLGHLPDGNTLALTGVGLIFPIVSIVAAFTSLNSSGGAPIFAMARGRKDEPRALQIQGTVYSLLLVSSLALMALCCAVKRPLLFLFGERGFVCLCGRIFEGLSARHAVHHAGDGSESFHQRAGASRRWA